eukprot:COSAG05_NODE_6719_length_914_cov_1.522699_1_plen_230_part_10
MHLRKWLRVLIDRSLLLGTVDRPSVHDLVLDFCVAQHSEEELRKKHCEVVEAFRAARPVDHYGRTHYDRSLALHSALTWYVCNNITGHVAKAMPGSAQAIEQVSRSWLADTPHDDIVYATGSIIGPAKLATLASDAEAAGDWWLASRYWAVARRTTYESNGMAAVVESKTTGRALDAMARVDCTRLSSSEAEACEDMDLAMFQFLLVEYNQEEIVPRKAYGKSILASGAG